MSSAEQATTITCNVNGQIVKPERPSKQCGQCSHEQQQSAEQLEVGIVAEKETDGLKHEITRLKCDKLDLLRQNVVSLFETVT